MNTNQLHYFLTLARQEHMSMTAEFLNISEAALSKSIRNLEAELGVPLFDRKGRRIRLNRNGEDFKETASRILAELENGRRHLQQYRFDYRGKIRITCLAFADGIMDCVTEYMRLNPHIQLELMQGLSGQTQVDEKVDILLNGYKSGELNSTWLEQPLYTEDSYFVISPQYKEYPPDVTALSIHDMKDEIFLSDNINIDLFEYENPLQRMCTSAGFQPKIVASSDDFMTKMRLVHEGIGITFLPRSCLRNALLLAPDARVFQILDYPARRTVYLMRKKDTQLSEAAMDFWNFALQFFEP